MRWKITIKMIIIVEINDFFDIIILDINTHHYLVCLI